MLRVEEIGDDYVMGYRYDTNGNLASVSRYDINADSSSILYAQTNTRGDVISLYDSNGATRVKYTYDSWGKLISATDANGNTLGENTVGALNSIRYRGYVYDSETGLYYLQSRYYDPEVGRFLNADSVDYIGYSGEVLSYNMFAYCENNAVCGWDVKGTVYDRSYFAKNILPYYTQLHNAAVCGATMYLNLLGYGCRNQVPTYRYDRNKGWTVNGYMDIYSYVYNLVWEVKRNNSSGIKAGMKQIKLYTSSYVKTNGYKNPGVKQKKIMGTVKWGDCLISYSSHIANGLIVYDYDELNPKGTKEFNRQWNTAKKYITIGVALISAVAVIGGLVYYLLHTGDVYTFSQQTKQVVEVAFANISKAA